MSAKAMNGQNRIDFVQIIPSVLCGRAARTAFTNEFMLLKISLSVQPVCDAKRNVCELTHPMFNKEPFSTYSCNICETRIRDSSKGATEPCHPSYPNERNHVDPPRIYLLLVGWPTWLANHRKRFLRSRHQYTGS